MLKTLFFIFFLHMQLASLGQMPESDSGKIKSILGSNYKQLDPGTKYPYSDLCSDCTVIPSLTLYKDTTGIVYNNEFLLFRHPLAYTDGRELMKLINVNLVTVKEYNEFQEYVRDSTAREKLHYGLVSDRKAMEFLIVDMEKVDKYGFKGPYSGNRFLNREKYALNWDKKFSYTDMEHMPILADMYLPKPQRYYSQRKFDDRKFVYKFSERYNGNQIPGLFDYQSYYWSNNVVPTFSNTYLWSGASEFDRDTWSVHGQLYQILFPNEMVMGITGVQANAFCNWKQQQIQKQLNSQGLKYNVIISLPLREDLAKIPIETPKYNLESMDFTTTWRITVKEYEQFIKSTQDSILTEELFSKIPESVDKMKLLESYDIFFNEEALEYGIMNPSRVTYYRSYFNLKHSKKMERKYASLVEEIKNSKVFQDPKFVYCLNDAHSRSIIGNLVPEKGWFEGKYLDSVFLIINEKDSLGRPIGLDYSYVSNNNLGHSTGVRAHEDLSGFYHRKEVIILPEKQIQQEKDDLIQGLTYEQAVAFYYWKFPIQFAKEGDDWHQYVIPSKEQFEAVQRGETVVMPEQIVEYPSPVFRYVIHVLPLND